LAQKNAYLHFDKAGGSEIPVPQDEGTETSTAAASLPPLLTIWDCEYVIRQGQGKGWLCKHCNLVFPNLHATRALAHCAKIPGNSIRICQALQPAAYLRRYKDLWNLTNAKISARKRAQIAVDEHTAARQEGENGHYLFGSGFFGFWVLGKKRISQNPVLQGFLK
jgi:hypothetical protein